MDIDLIVVTTIVALWTVAIGAAVSGTVDALGYAPAVWEAAGYQRRSWNWQAAFIVFAPGALVYSGIYLLRVRPKLVAAERAISKVDASSDAWDDRRRWYDRFSRPRRSPYEWDKAARRWWMWIPTALLSTASAVFYTYLDASHHGFGRGGFGYVAGTAWMLSALISAVKLGFWYGEHMRLTGRRPVEGGPLLAPGRSGSYSRR